MTVYYLSKLLLCALQKSFKSHEVVKNYSEFRCRVFSPNVHMSKDCSLERHEGRGRLQAGKDCWEIHRLLKLTLQI